MKASRLFSGARSGRVWVGSSWDFIRSVPTMLQSYKPAKAAGHCSPLHRFSPEKEHPVKGGALSPGGEFWRSKQLVPFNIH